MEQDVSCSYELESCCLKQACVQMIVQAKARSEKLSGERVED